MRGKIGDAINEVQFDLNTAFKHGAWSGHPEPGTPAPPPGPHVPTFQPVCCGLIQSSFGIPGNFELVFPAKESGILHTFRDNSAPGFPWSAPVSFGDGEFSGVSLIQSTFGNLEVVGVRGNQLVHLFRDAQFNWSGASVIAADTVRGTPSLIQSPFGDPGNFEVVVPSPGGGLMHFSRSNSDPNFPWSGATHFGDGEFQRCVPDPEHIWEP